VRVCIIKPRIISFYSVKLAAAGVSRAVTPRALRWLLLLASVDVETTEYFQLNERASSAANV